MHIDPDQTNLHHAIRQSFADATTITLLQIGANDGYDHDPIREMFQTDTRMQGHFVEPQKAAFTRLGDTYKACVESKRATLYNKAVFEKNQKIKLYKNLSGTDGHSTLLLRQDCDATRFEADAYEEVDGITFTNLMKKIKSDIDVLVIDTEGYDCTIIGHMLTTSCRPKVVFFERPNPTENDDRLGSVRTGNAVLDEVVSSLTHNGYEVQVLTGNVLAVKR